MGRGRNRVLGLKMKASERGGNADLHQEREETEKVGKHKGVVKSYSHHGNVVLEALALHGGTRRRAEGERRRAG